MKRPAPRARLAKPTGYHGIKWRESVHEGGHALAAFLLGMAVEEVSLPGPLGDIASVRTIARPHADPAQKRCLVHAAGAGAERARGLRNAQPSPADRANFVGKFESVGLMETYVEAAERLFRMPTVAPLLTVTAEFLYARHGSIIRGSDLLKALPEYLDAEMDLADDVLGALAGEEATDRYRRRGPCGETEERAS